MRTNGIFTVGDMVSLSDLGKKHKICRNPDRVGIVRGFTRDGCCTRVMWRGNISSVEAIHSDYLKKEARNILPVKGQ